LQRRVLDLSPDGTQIVLVLNNGLHIRSMSEPDIRPIQRSDGFTFVFDPTFSPDGRSVAFWAGTDRTLKRVAVTGGAAVIICPAEPPFGISWGADGIIFEGGSDARYLPTGHIVYALGGSLFAVAFDLDGLEVKGARVPVVEGVGRAPAGTTGAANFGVSSSGSLVYRPGPASSGASARRLGVADKKGDPAPRKLAPGPYEAPRVSPDGTRIAVQTSDAKEAIVWVFDLAGGTAMRRLTFGGNNRFPVWSGDGKRVAFQSDREGDLAIFWQPADGSSATAERLTKPSPGEEHVPQSWSPTTETLLFDVMKAAETSLWTFSLPDRKVMPFGAVRSAN
jgi:serine/threonine-protein kinase